MARKMKRVGRPPVYTGAVKAHIVALIRDHGASGARRILKARKGTANYALRNADLVPKPLSICLPTLFKLAAKAGCGLVPGRRAA